MKLSKKKIVVISVICIILAGFFIPRIINPFRRSEAGIERYLLKKIPLGTSYYETKEILLKETEKYSSFDGTVKTEKWFTDDFQNKKLNGQIYLDGYFNFLPDTEYSIWIYPELTFNENKELINIKITKSKVID